MAAREKVIKIINSDAELNSQFFLPVGQTGEDRSTRLIFDFDALFLSLTNKRVVFRTAGGVLMDPALLSSEIVDEKTIWYTEIPADCFDAAGELKFSVWGTDADGRLFATAERPQTVREALSPLGGTAYATYVSIVDACINATAASLAQTGLCQTATASTNEIVETVRGKLDAGEFVGPPGANGAAGPNSISTSTATNINGLIAGNGTNVSAPTSAQVGALPIPDASGSFTTKTIEGVTQQIASDKLLKEQYERNTAKRLACRTLYGLQKTICDFETSEAIISWIDGAIADDWVNFETGTKSVNSSGYTGAFSLEPLSGSWDLSAYKAISVSAFSYNSVSTLNSVVLKFYCDSGKTKGFTSPNVKKRIVVDNVFNPVPVRISECTPFGGASAGDWATCFRIDITSSGIYPAIFSISYDNLRGITYPTNKGKIIIRFDDGFASSFTEGALYMSQKGLKGYQNVITSRIDAGVPVGGRDVLTIAQLNSLQNMGWDIGSHTVNHYSIPTLDATPALLLSEIRDAYNWLNVHGFNNGSKYFTYPGHQVASVDYAVVNNYHAMAYCGAECIEVLPPLNPLAMHSLITEYRSAAEINAFVDDVATNGGLLTITFHDIIPTVTDSTYQVSQTIFRAVIDHIAISNVDVITLTDLYYGSYMARL